jgi:murein L,D-transpeptidase YcbB/YkuD
MTDKITIKGTAPKFDEQVLKQRQAARHNQYHLTSESFAVARGEIAFEFLANVINLANQGYELSDKYPIATSAMSYHAHMKKPSHVVHADLEALDEEEKQKYIADLEREREKYRQLVTAQLLQKAELAEAKKVADKQAKLLADVQKEVNELFGELVIPE